MVRRTGEPGGVSPMALTLPQSPEASAREDALGDLRGSQPLEGTCTGRTGYVLVARLATLGPSLTLRVTE